jgi:hypothetical protein
MVDAYSAVCAVEEVQGRIGGHAYRFLSVDDQGRLCVDFVGLAELVAEIVDEYTLGLRAALDEMRWESGIRENEVVQLGYELERAEARLAELDPTRLGVRDA